MTRKNGQAILTREERLFLKMEQAERAMQRGTGTRAQWQAAKQRWVAFLRRGSN